MAKITVQDTEITVVRLNDDDYLSLTNIARFKSDDPTAVIGNWMRNRNTIEFLGIWESLYNPHFNPIEFEGFRREAGLNAFTLSPTTSYQASLIYANEADVLNMAMFGKTAKQWREENPELKGNIRDYASVNQLICLSNMENLNAVFINQGISQHDRLLQLNQIAIQQMSVLEKNTNRKLLK